MIREQYFKIEVSGDPQTDTSIDKVISLTHIRMIKVDPEVKLITTNFARLSYRLTWEGIPRDLTKIDLAYKAAIRYSSSYLENWEMSIIVRYKETE